MKLLRIKPNSRAFGRIWGIYASSFPRDERREKKQLARILEDERCSLFGAYDGNEIVGFIGEWELGEFHLLEHFSVRGDLRGKGFGSRVLAAWMRGKKKVLSEVAKPSRCKDALKRIRFYKRMGFRLNRYRYAQPPYGGGKRAVPLYIMSYPQKLGRKEFLKARGIIHRIVYGRGKPFLG